MRISPKKLQDYVCRMRFNDKASSPNANVEHDDGNDPNELEDDQRRRHAGDDDSDGSGTGGNDALLPKGAVLLEVPAHRDR